MCWACIWLDVILSERLLVLLLCCASHLEWIRHQWRQLSPTRPHTSLGWLKEEGGSGVQCLKILLACFHCKNISSYSSLSVPQRFIPLAEERCPALQRPGRPEAERMVPFLFGFSVVSLHLWASVVKAGPIGPRRQVTEQIEGKLFWNYQCSCFRSRCFTFCFAFAFLYLSSPNWRSLEEALHYSPHPLPALT